MLAGSGAGAGQSGGGRCGGGIADAGGGGLTNQNVNSSYCSYCLLSIYPSSHVLPFNLHQSPMSRAL